MRGVVPVEFRASPDGQSRGKIRAFHLNGRKLWSDLVSGVDSYPFLDYCELEVRIADMNRRTLGLGGDVRLDWVLNCWD